MLYTAWKLFFSKLLSKFFTKTCFSEFESVTDKKRHYSLMLAIKAFFFTGMVSKRNIHKMMLVRRYIIGSKVGQTGLKTFSDY